MSASDIPQTHTPSTDWTLRYTLVGSAGPVQRSEQVWQKMIVAPSVDAESARQQDACPPPAFGGLRNSGTQQEASDATESIDLYVVASSSDLKPGESFESTFGWATTFDDLSMW